MRQFPRQAIVGLITAAVLGGCSSSTEGQSGVSYARYTFNCCAASDVGTAWHAGEAVTLHWAARAGAATSDNRIHPITITVVLAGPYADVSTLKSGAAASRTLQVATVNTNDRTPSLPASMFTLPADLAPGFYNLKFKFDFGGGNSAGGARIVEVASGP